MSEVKYKICSKCGAQMQIEEGVMTSSIPPMYRYRCPVCGGLEFDTEKYPMPKVMNEPKPIQPFYVSFDWESFRAEAAKDILCAMVSGGYGQGRVQAQAQLAKEYVDELIKQLKEK